MLNTKSRVWRPNRLVIGVTLVAAVLVSAGFVTAEDGQSSSGRILTTRVRSRISRLEISDLSASAKRSWGPEQAEGPPDVKAAGSNPLAWTSLSADGQVEWLLCEYDTAVEARAVIVHESAFPGALSKVSVFDADDKEIVAWEGDDPTPRGKARGVSVIPIKVKFSVSRIRVTINSPAVPGWNEIDAVGLEDAKGEVHWAKRVEASTSYATPRNSGRGGAGAPYSAAQAVGQPDTAGPGDHGTAWCPATAGGQPEWIECRYKTAQQPTEIVVHENLSPGGITKIGVFDDEGKEVTAWEGGVDPTPRDEPWGVSVFPVNVEFAFRKLKLYVDAPNSTGYHEIDAVGLRDEDGQTQWAGEAEASSSWGSYQGALADELVMPAMPAADRNFQDLKKEVETLRKQMKELQKQLQEITKSRKE